MSKFEKYLGMLNEEVISLNEMTEKQAVAAGYTFTGAYSHDKEDMKERAKKEIAKGNKAIVVNVPADKLSKGHSGMGYSVYYIKSEKNHTEEQTQAKKNKLASLETQKNKLESELKDIEKQISELKN